MSIYPYNDYRNYLIHYAEGQEAQKHKYIEKKRTKSGGIRYIYDIVKGVKEELSREDRYDDMGNPPKNNDYKPLTSKEEPDDRKRRIKNARKAMKKKIKDIEYIKSARESDRM